MANRHGVIFENGEPKLRFSIWRIFDPWVRGDLLGKQGFLYQHPQLRPVPIEYHFRRSLIRLVKSLGYLDHHIERYDQFLKEGGLMGPNPLIVFEAPEDAGIAADSVFHYMNLVIDDLARILPFILMDDPSNESQGFSDFKGGVGSKWPAPSSVIKLFSELENKNSWWWKGFRRGEGARQRLTHYTDLITFGGQAKEGKGEMSRIIRLGSISVGVREEDFEAFLYELLLGLFEWLDLLEQELFPLLAKRMEQKNIIWNPLTELPQTLYLRETKSLQKDGQYLYMPIIKN